MGQEMPTDRSLPVFDLKFEARLYDPKTWEICESYDNFNLLQDDNSLNERILCLKEVWLEVPLKTGGTVTRNYLAMGTGTNEGEEQSCEGKVLLFEVFKSQQVNLLELFTFQKIFQKVTKTKRKHLKKNTLRYSVKLYINKSLETGWRMSAVIDSVFRESK